MPWGFLHGGRANIQDFWSCDRLGAEQLPTTMTLRHFRFVLKCIHFDDYFIRQERKSEDKLATIREIMDAFTESCKKH